MDRDFYLQDTVFVAQQLLGKKLVRIFNGVELSGIIVETEGYGFTNDPASHAYRGKTPRNVAMFGQVGCAYVYFTYGVHYCFNVVARMNDMPAGAVLIRSLEPINGIEVMMQQRNIFDLKNLTNGPGKLTQALCITKNENGLDLTKKEQLYIAEGREIPENQIIAAPRIGIPVAKEHLWRFYIKDNAFVSKKS